MLLIRASNCLRSLLTKRGLPALSALNGRNLMTDFLELPALLRPPLNQAPGSYLSSPTAKRASGRQSCRLLRLCGSIGLLCLMALPGFSAQTISTLNWNGTQITGISDVRVREDDRIMVMHSGGGFSTTIDQLPVEFLDSWGLSKDSVEKVRSARQHEGQDGFESAVRNCMFREVEGVVYDLRKYQPDWMYFRQAKLLRY